MRLKNTFTTAASLKKKQGNTQNNMHSKMLLVRLNIAIDQPDLGRELRKLPTGERWGSIPVMCTGAASVFHFKTVYKRDLLKGCLHFINNDGKSDEMKTSLRVGQEGGIIPVVDHTNSSRTKVNESRFLRTSSCECCCRLPQGTTSCRRFVINTSLPDTDGHCPQ
uniref:Uncharacterized protein n=1 Tax=Timema shepardi TaxID=629360 RepID=A0A7R9ASV3_TIMSH|nr:unnamed protein product [Timema shepardi]